MLEVKNLHASIAGNEILKGINLNVKAGEVHAIMGPNGSGKSTLAQVLAGKDGYDLTEGEVIYNGKNLFDLLSSHPTFVQHDSSDRSVWSAGKIVS